MEIYVSFFKNGITDVRPEGNYPIEKIFESIETSEPVSEVIDALRSASNEADRKAVKTSLPYFTPSGTFRAPRSDATLLVYSYLICIDYDHVPDPEALKGIVAECPYTYAAFVSPSGEGLKVFVRISTENVPTEFVKFHKEVAYPQVAAYYRQFADVDKLVDVSHACFVSYDPKIFVNRYAEIFEIDTVAKPDSDRKAAPEKTTPDRKEPKSERERKINREKVESILTFLTEKGESLTPSYESWSKVRFALADAFGDDEGFDFFCRFSALDRNADPPEELRKKWDYDVKNTQKKKDQGKISIGTLYRMAQDVGWVMPKKQYDPRKFWETDYSDPENPKIIINIDGVCGLLECFGFAKYLPPGASKYRFVRIENNIAEEVSDEMMQSFVNEYTRENVSDYRVWRAVCASCKKVFSGTAFGQLRVVKFETLRDTKTESYLFYQNGYLHIFKNDKGNFVKKFKPYETLPTPIWKSAIIDREFRFLDATDYLPVGKMEDYKRKNEFGYFLHLISGKDADRTFAAQSALGYLLHDWKNPANPKAILGVDEEIPSSKGEANGGTGKGIFFKAISKFRPMLSMSTPELNGKNRFVWQSYSIWKRFVFFSDVKASKFDLHYLFSMLTDDFSVEQKGLQEQIIPQALGPKIGIATNGTLKGEGGAHDRRLYVIEFAPYFNKKYTVEDEFNHLLFDDWDEHQWAVFDNFMVDILQEYLQKGLYVSVPVNYGLRKLIDSTAADFVEWAEINLTDGTVEVVGKLAKRFHEEFPDYEKQQINQFSGWCSKFCALKKLNWKVELSRHEGKVLRIANITKNE